MRLWTTGRSGDEPLTARSALGLRLVLAVFGVLCAIGGAVFFTLVVYSLPWVIGFAVAGVLIAIDLVVVVHRIRQGPHFQPGKTTPPYRPVEPPRHLSVAGRQPVPIRVRRRRYIVIVAISAVLLVLAWVVVNPFSTVAALVISAIAMVLLIVGVMVANGGSPITRV